MYHVQEYIETAINSQFSLLEYFTDLPGHKEKLASAVQLMCTVNLQLNKFRWDMASPYVNKDIKKALMTIPVTHDNLFGKDIQKSVEEVVKVQASTSKALALTKQKSSYPRAAIYLIGIQT